MAAIIQTCGFSIDNRSQEAIKDTALAEAPWRNSDSGNLEIVAKESVESTRLLAALHRDVAKLVKLAPRIERVLKLFETVLAPVAKQVEEREAAQQQAVDELLRTARKESQG